MRIFLIVFLFIASSCNKSSWERYIILPEQEIIFIESPRMIVKVFINSKDSIVIKNKNFVNHICYLRKKYPQKNISITYIKKSKRGKVLMLKPMIIGLERKN